MSMSDGNRTTPTLTPEEISRLGALTETETICNVLGVSERYARQLLRDGAIKGVKLGRFWRVNTASLLEFAGLV